MTAVSKPREAARVFDINGVASTVEDSVAIIKKLAPEAAISFAGSPLPFPMNLSDQPVRSYLGNYGSVPVEAGIRGTHEAFQRLLAERRLSAESLA